MHAAYWKYAVFRRLSGAARGSFPLKGSNWFPRENISESTWRKDVALLDEMHRSLREAVTMALSDGITESVSKVALLAAALRLGVRP